jgi:hypothetical protein
MDILNSSTPTTDVKTYYSGTISDPWKITSVVTDNYNAQEYGQREMDDVVTPQWNKKRASGVIVNSPYESTTLLYNVGVRSIARECINRNGTSPNYYYSGFTEFGTALCGGPSNWAYLAAPSVSDSIISEAITEAWSKVSLNEADILLQVAESQKTIYGLVSIFRRVLKIARNVSRLRLAELRKEITPKELANRWMEARYALRPLMYDAHGLISATTDYKRSTRNTFRSYKYIVAEDTSTNQLLWSSSAGGIRGNMYASRTLEVRAGVLTLLTGLQNMLVWGVTEPIETLYELLPYSFVLDWFFNVGKLIASWSPNVGLKKLASWSVVTETTFQQSTITSAYNTGSYNYRNYRNESGTYTKTSVFQYRTPEPSLPVLPVYSLHLNKAKLLDLGIMIRNLINR